MSFVYQRRYQGPVRAVLLDWAGTTMDFGCMAPAVVFVKVFERAGVPITMERRARPWAPTSASTSRRSRSCRPCARGGRPGTAAHPTTPTSPACSRSSCRSSWPACPSTRRSSPGTLEVVSALRARGVKIGSTTGYLREMMEINLRDAKQQGYEPDSTVCASDVPAGRPYPYMCLQNVINLQVWPVEACVKIDDTVPGIEEGLNAGTWTIGLAVSGNEVGLSLAAWSALPDAEQAGRRQRAHERMRMAGAHHVVDTIADVLPCIEAIEARLARGERP